MIQLDIKTDKQLEFFRKVIKCALDTIVKEESEKATTEIQKRIAEFLPKLESTIYKNIEAFDSRQEIKVVIQMIIKDLNAIKE